ncbi:hypothetical protein SXCC_02663 [Gluconacetobacter sp. SXCC-1]|nr:hypothetical protein SXCC_02663 [Gluconacetobacter sp. SXCC-1]
MHTTRHISHTNIKTGSTFLRRNELFLPVRLHRTRNPALRAPLWQTAGFA